MNIKYHASFFLKLSLWHLFKTLHSLTFFFIANICFETVFYKQKDDTFGLTISCFFSQVTVTSATYTFPGSWLSVVVSNVLYRVTFLESDFTSNMILRKLTQRRSSLANEKFEVGRWKYLINKSGNFSNTSIGWEKSTLLPIKKKNHKN